MEDSGALWVSLHCRCLNERIRDFLPFHILLFFTLPTLFSGVNVGLKCFHSKLVNTAHLLKLLCGFECLVYSMHYQSKSVWFCKEAEAKCVGINLVNVIQLL